MQPFTRPAGQRMLQQQSALLGSSMQLAPRACHRCPRSRPQLVTRSIMAPERAASQDVPKQPPASAWTADKEAMRPLTQAKAQLGAQQAPAQPPKTMHKQKDPFAVKEVYHDNAAERAMTNFFAGKMAQQLGVDRADFAPGYDGFVELSTLMMKGRSSKQQQAVTIGVLNSLLPSQAPTVFRKLFPFTKWSAEANARLTTMFFSWLVGPMELKDVEIERDGRTETWRSGVLIKKCRYLEASGCVGMCTNMCKIPTQDFFTNQFGLPLTMDPNFEDLSCEMIYGRTPPHITQDKMYGQPCFVQECSLGNDTVRPPCPKVDSERAAPKDL